MIGFFLRPEISGYKKEGEILSYTSMFKGLAIDQILGDSQEHKNEFLDKIYPVGSVYLTFAAADLSTLFGGTWQQIEGRFLYCVANDLASGSLGGVAAHFHTTGDLALTVAQIPSHNHTRGTMNITGAMTSMTWNDSVGFYNFRTTGAFYNVSTNPSGRVTSEDTYWNSGSDDATLLGFDASRNWTGETSSVGDGTVHNHGTTNSSSNLPPYIAVYAWQRIS